MSKTVFPNDLPTLTHAHMAEKVLDWLSRHPELEIHPSSRIPALCRLTSKAAGRVTMRGEAKYTELEQSFKDVQEVWLAVHQLGDRLARPPFVEPFIRAATYDAQLPEDSGDNTRGRDAQFELFVGAIGDRVGFDVSHLGEGQPDWQMAARVRKWSVEAKRAKSSDAVIRQVKKAAVQIENSKVGGVIALDVSAVEGAAARRLAFCLSDDNMERARLEMGDAILKRGLPDMRRAIGNAPVSLIILHDYLIRPAGQKPNGEMVPCGLHGMWWAYYLEPQDSMQYPRYQEFWQLWSLGLPNL